MRRLLWVGDAVISSGFAKCTHKTLEALRETWAVHVLGINYVGDPHQHPYPIYPCWPGGDTFGVKRTKQLVLDLKPDMVVLQNDPWNIPAYLDKIEEAKYEGPVVAALAVDGKNCRGEGLNRLDRAIFWTEFGQREAREGGYTGDSSVIPLGVDLSIYKPQDRVKARVEMMGLPPAVANGFIVGNVNRNQPRKRLDLTIQYFAEWVNTHKIEDAYLFLHVAPTGDVGYDVRQLMKYYGMAGRLILAEPDMGHGNREHTMPFTYSSFDVQVSTTQGEGWGLCTLEGMACGVPQLVPDWAALGEWARPAARLVGCKEICVTANNVNAIGGVPDREDFVEALHALYLFETVRLDHRERGLRLAASPEFRWENIGAEFEAALELTIARRKVA